MAKKYPQIHRVNTDSYRLALVKEIKACLKMSDGNICRVSGPFSYMQGLESVRLKKLNKLQKITYYKLLSISPLKGTILK